MLPTLASACFLQRNPAFIARGLFTRCAGPSLLPMNLHQHQFSVSGPQAWGGGSGHGARETCHARPASRRGGLAVGDSPLPRPCDGLRASGRAPCLSPSRERDLPLLGERSHGSCVSSRERGAPPAIPIVTDDAISADHYPAGGGAFNMFEANHRTSCWYDHD
jgi:hypothetical protein